VDAIQIENAGAFSVSIPEFWVRPIISSNPTIAEVGQPAYSASNFELNSAIVVGVSTLGQEYTATTQPNLRSTPVPCSEDSQMTENVAVERSGHIDEQLERVERLAVKLTSLLSDLMSQEQVVNSPLVDVTAAFPAVVENSVTVTALPIDAEIATCPTANY
jgi:hypothetical protein